MDNMDWPEFVKEVEERLDLLMRQDLDLTGWETVVFELEDAHDSDCSTAAIAP